MQVNPETQTPTPVEVFLNETREKVKVLLGIEEKKRKIEDVVEKLAGVKCEHVNVDYDDGTAWCWEKLPLSYLVEEIVQYITHERIKEASVVLYITTKKLENKIDVSALSKIDIERLKQVFGENVNVLHYFDEDLEEWVYEIQIPLEPQIYNDVYQYLILYM